jgi:glycosyltransferase involved in cell wall biosynthesis
VIEIKLCIAVAQVAGDIDVVFFHLCGAFSLPPLLVAKVLGKKTITNVNGRGSLSAKRGYRSFMRKYLLANLLGLLESAVFALSDQIAVQSPAAISFLELDRYRVKIAIRSTICIDTSSFREITRIVDRALSIGYIGRLDPGKGISNLIKALSDLTTYRNDLKVLIAGEGSLFNTLEAEIERSGQRSHVELKKWVPHEDIPLYLNQLRLLILPSDSEGLPRIVLEAMACGTVVVATPVGGIPDVIADGHTGFILEDSSPECIARTVIRAIQHPNLSQIAQNAHMEIENTYSFSSLIEQYRNTLARYVHPTDS